ncbi:hypothetical protein SERLADRAFT_350623, partial [Serpula lacrymans var. lacrymans S7.9]
KTIQMNLLCNPTGKANKFRAVDWLVERNNLYTKVIYSGTGPNCTIKHVIKESPLIEVYQNCHMTIKNAFHLQHCTIWHTPPDMTKTIQKLAARIREKSPHSFKQGREAIASITDKVVDGLALMHMTILTDDDETEDHFEFEAEDLYDD